MSLLLHPDKNPDLAAAQALIKVNEAYEVLKDPYRRASTTRRSIMERRPVGTRITMRTSRYSRRRACRRARPASRSGGSRQERGASRRDEAGVYTEMDLSTHRSSVSLG